MIMTWGPAGIQWLELHVLMKPGSAFKNPEMENIIQCQQ